MEWRPSKSSISAACSLLAKGLDWYGRGSFATKRELASFLQGEGFYPSSLHVTVAEKRVTRVFKCLGMYAGFIEYAPWNISQVEGKHKPLISKETFYRILARESKSSVGIQKTTEEASHFELRNFVCCIECGKPLTGSFAKGKYPRYHCYNQRCAIYGHSIKRDNITADFETLLKSLEARTELMELIGLLTKKAWSDRLSTWSQGARQYESEIESITGAISVVGHRLGRTADDEAAVILESEIKEMKVRRDLLLVKVSKFQKDPPNFEEAFNRVSTIIQDPYSYWKSGGMVQKKTVHRMVFTVSPRYDRNTGFSTVTLTLPYLISTTSKNDSSRLVVLSGMSLHKILEEVTRWRTLLIPEYQKYLMLKQ